MRVIRKVMVSFGGVYGNADALRALLKECSGIAPESFVCTGDLAGYCAEGAEVCRMMQTELAGSVIVRGNCERTIAADDDDCGCGFTTGSACDRLSVAWHAHAKSSISADDKQWMGGLPAQLTIEFGGRKIAVMHADAQTDNNFIFASTCESQKRAALAESEADAVIAGHSGIPFTQDIGGRIWHNSGALGMPANDGTSRVWYAVWTETADGIRIEHRSLQYDVCAAQAAMEAAALPPEYRQTLQTGIWPSDDILPPEEKACQGRSISLSPRLWAQV